MKPSPMNKAGSLVLAFELLILILSLALIFNGGDQANTGYLLLGATLTLLATFGADIWKRAQTSKELAHVLYIELAIISERCRNDFNNPWGQWIIEDKELDVFRTLKFSPTRPLLFESAGVNISLFDPGISSALLKFYTALSAWKRDLDNACDTAQQTGLIKIRSDKVRTISIRLGMTMKPAKEAIIQMRKLVPNFLMIDRDILKISSKNDQPFTEDELLNRLNIEIKRFETDIQKYKNGIL